MPAPTVMSGVPPGLEYLAQIDQLLVNQQIELLECMLPGMVQASLMDPNLWTPFLPIPQRTPDPSCI